MQKLIETLKRKLSRRETDIVNIRKKLDETLNKLDELQTEHDVLENYIIQKIGKHAYRDKFCYVNYVTVL